MKYENCKDCKYLYQDDSPCKWCRNGNLFNEKARKRMQGFRQVKYILQEVWK